MNAIDHVLTGAATPGLYRLLARASSAEIGDAVTARGWRFFWLDGRRARDKSGFLAAAAAAMEFPAYFGHNWDAFEECVNDLSWAPAAGYVLLYDQLWWLACGDPRVWQTARSILEDASEKWNAADIPFYTLVRYTQGCGNVAAALRDSRA